MKRLYSLWSVILLFSLSILVVGAVSLSDQIRLMNHNPKLAAKVEQAEKQQKKSKTTAKLRTVTRTTPSVMAKSATEAVLTEDFSMFTLGDEATPDATDIANLETGEIPASYTQVAGWYGVGVHQAGGTCALMIANGETGFIETPLFDGADVATTFSFRVKSLNPAGDQLAVISVDYQGEGEAMEDAGVNITNQWQSVTLTFEQGAADETIQLYAMEFECLIDDIVITQSTPSGLKVPTVLPATEVTATGFTANWKSVANATSYLLDVYSYGAVSKAAMNITEGFDEIASTDGKMIDTANPNYPKDWTIEVTKAGTSRDLYTTAGNFQSGAQSLAFDATGDYIITPLLTGPATTLSLWIKNQQGDATSYITVEAYNGATWSEMAKVTPATAASGSVGATIDLSSSIPAGTTQFKFSYTKGKGNVSIDDVSIDYDGVDSRVYLLKDEAVAETSKAVGGTQDGTQYYYRVRATDGTITTSYSDEMMVEPEAITELAAPVALPATEITADSYTANWEAVADADVYALYGYLTYIAPADKNYTIFEEDFSGITEGTIEAPVEGGLVEYLDSYTAIPDFMVYLPYYAAGMVGFSNQMIEFIPGMLTSPVLDLSALSLDYTVTATVVGKVGDVISIMMIENSEENAEAQNKEITLTAATQTITATFNLFKPAYCAIMSSNEGITFVDQFKLETPMKANESVFYPHLYTETASTSVVVTPINFSEGYLYSYNVQAYNLAGEEAIGSDFSNLIQVNGGSGVDHTTAASFNAYIQNNQLHLTLDQAATIDLFSTTGQRVYSVQGVSGSNVINLDKETLYLVRVANKQGFKVMAK